jgi:hypothetical protein
VTCVTIQDLGSIGELVAAIATVATLVYLALQISQNTRALRAGSSRETSAAMIEWLHVLHRPGVRRAMAIGLRAYPNMSADDKGHFAYAFDSHVNTVTTVFALHRGGLLDQEHFEATLVGLACHLTTPGGNAYWQDTKGFLLPDMVRVIDQRVREGGLMDILENPHFQLDEAVVAAAQQSAAADSA